jgi:hypothetical protein
MFSKGETTQLKQSTPVLSGGAKVCGIVNLLTFEG